MTRAAILWATAAAASWCVSAAAVESCWNPLGCEPKTFQDCIQQAAEAAKTEGGAKALIAECDRFKVTDETCRADAAEFQWSLTHPSQPMLDARKKVEALQGLDDDQAVDYLHEAYYPDLSREGIAAKLGVKLHPDRALCRRFHASLYR